MGLKLVIDIASMSGDSSWLRRTPWILLRRDCFPYVDEYPTLLYCGELPLLKQLSKSL